MKRNFEMQADGRAGNQMKQEKGRQDPGLRTAKYFHSAALVRTPQGKLMKMGDDVEIRPVVVAKQIPVGGKEGLGQMLEQRNAEQQAES